MSLAILVKCSSDAAGYCWMPNLNGRRLLRVRFGSIGEVMSPLMVVVIAATASARRIPFSLPIGMLAACR